MGLAVAASFDPVTLFTTGNYPSAGEFLQNVGGGDTWRGFITYYDRLDFFACISSSAGGGLNHFMRWDPLLLSNSGSIFDNSTSFPAQTHFAVGEWNRGANTQKMYSWGTANTPLAEVQPLAVHQVDVADPFPNVGSVQHRGSLLSTQAGFYDIGIGGWVVFETLGYAFNPAVRLRHTDLVQYADVPVTVDLVTGAATLVDGLITAFGTQTHQFSEPALFAQNVSFIHCQFVPDDISTPSAPRGVMYLFSAGANNPADTTFSRFWVKSVDWNPLNIAGTPSRTHLRQRLLSAVDLLKATPASVNGIHETGATIGKAMFFHPRTSRLLFYSSQAGQAQLDAAESKFVLISSTPSLNILTDPSPIEEVATGKTVSFSTDALGTLNEPVAGISLDFQLRRVTTIDELLTIGAPGSTSTVANVPISPADPNLSPVIVKKNDIPLTETTHYTLNRTLGQIIFVAPEPVAAQIYEATYRHFTVPASPPHGELLNASAVTDLSGAAIARVRYAEEDPVPDKWDRIDATN